MLKSFNGMFTTVFNWRFGFLPQYPEGTSHGQSRIIATLLFSRFLYAYPTYVLWKMCASQLYGSFLLFMCYDVSDAFMHLHKYFLHLGGSVIQVSPSVLVRLPRNVHRIPTSFSEIKRYMKYETSLVINHYEVPHVLWNASEKTYL